LGRRVAVTSLVALGAITAFAVIGGTGLAKELANPGKSQYGAGGQYHGKVTVCHKGHVTISVAMVAWFRAHQHHGDTMGPCSAAAVQAAKLKAAKVKAAKLKAKHGHSTETGAATTAAPTTTHGSKGKAKGHASSASGDTGSSQTVTTPPSTGHGNGNGNGQGNGHGKNG
jgi:hypothetical protein